jgi:UDP-N-acetylglucosamine:LPS N-acetylglucosamine transferase
MYKKLFDIQTWGVNAIIIFFVLTTLKLDVTITCGNFPFAFVYIQEKTFLIILFIFEKIAIIQFYV